MSDRPPSEFVLQRQGPPIIRPSHPGNLYHIEVVDFQIAAILYSESFRASVEAAVKAKNEAVAAENTVNRIRFEAEQAVARANGEAEAKLRIADADRLAAILNAQGKAEAIPLEGGPGAK